MSFVLIGCGNEHICKYIPDCGQVRDYARMGKGGG